MKTPPPPSANETKWYNTKINFYMVLLVVSTFTSGGVMYHLGVKTGEQNLKLGANKWQVKCYLEFLNSIMDRPWAHDHLPSDDHNSTIENGK